MADFDARGKTVEDDAAHFCFEDVDEFRVFLKIFRSAMDGGGEMPREVFSRFEDLLFVGVADYESGRAEVFGGQVGVGLEGDDVRFEEGCCGGGCTISFGGLSLG